MKQKYKGKTITQKTCIKNILSFYDLATIPEIKEGLFWYDNANKYCKELAGRFDISVSQVAGIIAAFSPQTGWQENKRFALSFLLSQNGMKFNEQRKGKAKKILILTNETDIYYSLSVNDAAWKTKAFFLNILNPDLLTDVTIDRHAIAVTIQTPNTIKAMGDNSAKITEGQYRFFEKCYVLAAKELDILPQQLQAIAWTVYRRLRELRQYDESKGWQPFDTTVDNPF